MANKQKHAYTPYVVLNTRKCKACWKCIEICHQHAIRKINSHGINTLFLLNTVHAPDASNVRIHARIKQLPQIFNNMKSRSKHTLLCYFINCFLLLSAMPVVFSGLTLQIGYHMGGSHIHQPEIKNGSASYEQSRTLDTKKIICGFDYYKWSYIHKYAIVMFSLLMILHGYLHRKWYTKVITRFLIAKNKLVILLTIIFIAVAITGFIPWLADLSGSTGKIRLRFIETHDKLTMIFILMLVWHIVKKVKWFFTAFSSRSNR